MKSTKPSKRTIQAHECESTEDALDQFCEKLDNLLLNGEVLGIACYVQTTTDEADAFLFLGDVDMIELNASFGSFIKKNLV